MVSVCFAFSCGQRFSEISACVDGILLKNEGAKPVFRNTLCFSKLSSGLLCCLVRFSFQESGFWSSLSRERSEDFCTADCFLVCVKRGCQYMLTANLLLKVRHAVIKYVSVLQ